MFVWLNKSFILKKNIHNNPATTRHRRIDQTPFFIFMTHTLLHGGLVLPRRSRWDHRERHPRLVLRPLAHHVVVALLAPHAMGDGGRRRSGDDHGVVRLVGLVMSVATL